MLFRGSSVDLALLTLGKECEAPFCFYHDVLKAEPSNYQRLHPA